MFYTDTLNLILPVFIVLKKKYEEHQCVYGDAFKRLHAWFITRPLRLNIPILLT